MTPLGILIAQLILQYGPGLAVTIIGLINKNTVEEIDLETLRAIKPPSAYLTLPGPLPDATPPALPAPPV